jgi:hypothetical protein
MKCGRHPQKNSKGFSSKIWCWFTVHFFKGGWV